MIKSEQLGSAPGGGAWRLGQFSRRSNGETHTEY